ncbi:hypothetical protein B0O99DRAFT_58312 [Bisporella sp. PMI_857]|nr:hypothetical protein B0O99DRAFT_58312 [Bisporella sp. PMI_857]
MGIKGIYGEIGPGKRVALSKLSIEKFIETGRPLRVAIDISIWQFQIQAGKGGTNPAIRTFYYRLLKLLSVSVQPLFVFDGPHKPPFKRNKRSGHHGASIPNLMCKQLLNLFGFPFHIAPGEAEAECALLQREGVVDAVLSEDVDTLMFGCGLTFRNWSSEGQKGNKSPTHVSVYDSKVTKAGKSGLDRESMILIALMSGGDYITEGIPGAGIKVACEAARAGYGKSLCQLSRSDSEGLDNWRQSLSHELQSNESKFFRCKHKSLKIPDNFPNREVLAYYTHPIVSSSAKLQRLREGIEWDGEIDIPGLRLFVAEAFDWTHKTGAVKFIRGLAPVLLAHKLRVRGNRRDSGYGDLILTEMNEIELVRAICGKRNHFSTEGMTELRLIYLPNDIVGLNLDEELDDSNDYDRNGLAPLQDDEQIEAYMSDVDEGRSTSPSKRGSSIWDPNVLDKIWISETIAKVGIPLKVEDYEESLRNPKKALAAKAVAKKVAKSAKLIDGGMPKGAIDRFVRVSKPNMDSAIHFTSNSPEQSNLSLNKPDLPPAFLTPALEGHRSLRSNSNATTKSSDMESHKPAASTRTRGPAASKPIQAAKYKTKTKQDLQKQNSYKNPWTLASSSPFMHPAPHITKTLQQATPKSLPSSKFQAPDFCSSPVANITSSPPEQPPLPSRKHVYSPLPESGSESELPTMPSARSPHQPPRTPSNRKQSPRKKRSTSKSPVTQSETADLLTSISALPKVDLPPGTRDVSASPDLPPFKIIGPSTCNASSDGCERVTHVIDLSFSPEILRETGINMAPRRQTKAPTEMEEPKPREQKKYIMLRESLPGAWNEVDESKVTKGKSRAWRYSQVEVLDLTSSG